MREFRDENGAVWVASVEERDGDDYKGRYALRITPGEGVPEEAVEVEDVRWNSPKTAERTLKTMSEGELRRRLRIGLGRKA
jgi:hypothetical protein